MAGPFEIWRLAWANAAARGFQHLADLIPAEAASREAAPIAVTPSPVFGRVRLELSTMRLIEQREPTATQAPPTLIVAPFAVHEASIADFAEGHSLSRAMAESGAGYLAVTWWKSATVEMRDYGIDAYLSDLNVAIDDLGGRASLVGLCQGGWLAAAYAARFPAKVAKLALAGAPIDLAAAESHITRSLALVPLMTIAQLVALGGGRVFGAFASALWPVEPRESAAEEALQCAGDRQMVERFDKWNARTVDLPGAYFMQTAEWIFRENRLARGSFPALGRCVALSSITAPIFVLAAADDEIMALPQAIAVKSLCPETRVEIRVEPGRHLSLFMGRRTIGGAWREIGRWLAGRGSEAAPAPEPGNVEEQPRNRPLPRAILERGNDGIEIESWVPEERARHRRSLIEDNPISG
jgi:poly(3-hydroxyalkanoate) synthetase